MQKEEYLIKNACYSQAKYYLCKQNNKRSLLGRKQRSQVARSFPNRYLFSFTNKVTSLFSISCILRIILRGKKPLIRGSLTTPCATRYYTTENESRQDQTATEPHHLRHGDHGRGHQPRSQSVGA